MKEKILVLGSSIACSIGICALLVALSSVAVEIAYASQTEIYIAGDQCKEKTSGGDCGPNDCPPDTPLCHLLKNNKCDCEAQ
jgi:hypothetical protein